MNRSVRMALLLLLRLQVFLFAIPLRVFCASYIIPPGWDLLESYTTRIAGKSLYDTDYYIANNGSIDIVSDKGTFALVFTMSTLNGLMLVMKSNDSQVFAMEEGLKYQLPLIEISSIELDECGRVTMLQRDSRAVYPHTQSVLLPLCPVTSPWLLSSSPDPTVSSNLTGFSNGGFTLSSRSTDFAAMLYPGGFALQLGLEVYAACSFKGGCHSTYESDLVDFSECKGHRTSLVLENNGTLTMRYRDISGTGKEPVDCRPPVTIPLQKLDQNSAADSELRLPFLKITSTGHLVLYKLDRGYETWVVDSMLMLNSGCKSMLACGLDSVCDLDGGCSRSLAKGITSDGPRDLNYARQHGLNWRRSGVGYINTRFQRPHLVNTSLEYCANQTRFQAAFYDHNSGSCYGMKMRPSGSLHRDENITAFINFNTALFDKYYPSFKNAFTLSVGILIVAIHLIVTTLAIILLPIVQAKLNASNPTQAVEALLSTMQGLPQRFSYTEMDTATRGFTTKLGAGGFGSVYEGYTKDARHVAVKKLDDNGTESAKQFVTEIAGIGGVSHFNIVKLCGFCIDGATQKFLVYEFMPNGSLDSWLFRNDPNKTLSWDQRLNIALGTARGLCYLHEECSEPILHLDIKPQNILLDEKFEAKVADFGMAKLLMNRDVTHVETNVRGTPGYMAPEWLLQYAATKKCDVYSYGMLLLELIGSRKNVDVAKINEADSSWFFPALVVDRVKAKNYFEVVDARVRNLASEEDVEMMVRVALWCIQDNPVARPSMSDVVEILQKRKKVEEPPFSFYFDREDQSQLLWNKSMFLQSLESKYTSESLT